MPSKGYTHDSIGYAAYAKYLMDSLVDNLGFDGYDIDIEDNLTGQTLLDRVGIYKALSKYLGPASGTGKLLTYDTNQKATGSGGFFLQTYPLMDYVLFQHYGGSTTKLQTTFNGYSLYIPPSKFIPGFSFYEENGKSVGNIWYDVKYPDDITSRCYQYAKWQPTQGTKGGLIAYALDRDVPRYTDTIIPADWHVTRKIISQIMNPPKIITSISTENYIKSDVSQFYPNPANDKIFITINPAQFNEKYAILDLSGRILLSGCVDKSANEIEVSSLSSGVYIFEVSDRHKQLLISR